MTENEKLNQPQVLHNAAEERFELRIGDELCQLNYRRTGSKLVIYRTAVPPALEGRRFAALMTRAALDFARSEMLQVEPRCSYTAAFMQKHPAYADLFAPG
jgi:predicted GNAT family acetyltransferase